MKTDNRKKKKIHTLLPMLTIVVGVLLIIFKIAVDSEPGAIPLLLIVLGTGWFTLKNFRRGRKGRIAFF